MNAGDERPTPEETEITGTWASVGGRAIADESCRRIERLTTAYLVRIATDRASGGWAVLFRDPGDGRLWERDYPQSELHGGGPPRLRAITDAEAARRYSVD